MSRRAFNVAMGVMLGMILLFTLATVWLQYDTVRMSREIQRLRSGAGRAK